MSRGESKVDLLRLFLSLLLSPDPTRATPVIMAKHDRVGSGVKHLSRTDSRPVTWVIKIKHAGLGVLGHFRMILSHKLQASSDKRQAKKDLTGSCIHDNVGLINQQKGYNEILYFIKI